MSTIPPFVICSLDAMSYTLTLKERSSVLSANYFPPIDLSSGNRSVSLIGLETYISIPNITKNNNKLHLEINGVKEIVEIEPGAYGIDELNRVLNQLGKGVELRASINTLKSEIRTLIAAVDLSPKDSIGPLLGFTKSQVLKWDSNKFYSSYQTVDIQTVSTIRIECNIATNSYLNDKLVHTIYGFLPTNAIYLPVTVQALDYLELRIVNQNNQLVDFRGEEIIVRLHLRQNGSKV